ncbi:MAG: hypothetical protein LBG81_01330 [Coriobacteriaceae bacterium]|jgi:hypothetical protein|nr:hypothetical protein [Coriobacteriaceae bacterium]
MDVFVCLKSAGRRKPALARAPYTLPEDISSLRQLIEAVVFQEVERYNSRGVDHMLVPFLTEAETADQATGGKVGFGRLYSEKKADPQKALKTALEGFEDGLFRVMIGRHEACDLDAPLWINEGDTLTFIRLFFLTGRLW